VIGFTPHLIHAVYGAQEPTGYKERRDPVTAQMPWRTQKYLSMTGIETRFPAHIFYDGFITVSALPYSIGWKYFPYI
jgi:hypothetical protein